MGTRTDGPSPACPPRLDTRIDRCSPIRLPPRDEARRGVASRRPVLRPRIGGRGAVLGRGLLLQLDAEYPARKLDVIAGPGEFGTLHGQRADRHQGRTVEVLEHEQSAAPIGKIEIADDTADFQPVMRLPTRTAIEAF